MKNGTPVTWPPRVVLWLVAAASMWQIFGALGKDRKEMEQLVSQIENALPMPVGAHQLAEYDRFYANGEDKERDVIVGIFRYSPTARGTVYIVAYQSLPAIFDGGCNVIRIRYSKAKREHERIECNGDA